MEGQDASRCRCCHERQVAALALSTRAPSRLLLCCGAFCVIVVLPDQPEQPQGSQAGCWQSSPPVGGGEHLTLRYRKARQYT